MLLWVSIVSLVLTLAFTLEIAVGLKKLTHLKDIPPAKDVDLPMVSIIIPACNEADTIEPALQSVLTLDYQNLEIIVINDRSTDTTGEILKRMQKDHPIIKYLEVSATPTGWMGKSHALQHGANHASGDYLLFTDADIVMEKSTLKRAMSHVLQNQLDHLSMFFENIAPGGVLNSLLLDVYGGLLLLFKPWKAADKKSTKFMGVGAFNMVKASAYKSINGHKSFSMNPIDDIMLGKVLKQNGFAQDCLLGHGFVQVKWYGSVRSLINGVMKNTFAIYNFNVIRVLAGCLFIFTMGILPFWGIFLTSGATRLIFAAAVIIRVISFVHGFSYSSVPLRNSIYALVTPYINIYIALKATIMTLRNNGINWRDTHYSLDEMKRQEPLL